MDPLVVLLVILLLMSLQQRFIFLCLGLRCLSLRFLGRMGWMVRSHEAFLLPLIVMLLPDLFEDIPGLKMGEQNRENDGKCVSAYKDNLWIEMCFSTMDVHLAKDSIIVFDPSPRYFNVFVRWCLGEKLK